MGRWGGGETGGGCSGGGNSGGGVGGRDGGGGATYGPSHSMRGLVISVYTSYRLQAGGSTRMEWIVVNATPCDPTASSVTFALWLRVESAWPKPTAPSGGSRKQSGSSGAAGSYTATSPLPLRASGIPTATSPSKTCTTRPKLQLPICQLS